MFFIIQSGTKIVENRNILTRYKLTNEQRACKNREAISTLQPRILDIYPVSVQPFQAAAT